MVRIPSVETVIPENGPPGASITPVSDVKEDDHKIWVNTAMLKCLNMLCLQELGFNFRFELVRFRLWGIIVTYK